MPLGILSEEEFNKEVGELSAPILDKEKKLGRNGKIETPNSLRKVISGEVIEGGSKSEVSKAFGISQSSINAYIHGATSEATYNKVENSLALHNMQVKDKIIGLTRRKLKEAVRHITTEKLAAAKAGELSVVARNMSSIANDLEPEVKIEETKKVVVTYRPRIRQEDDFEILSVSE